MRYAKNTHQFGTRLRTTLRLMGVCTGVVLLSWSCKHNRTPIGPLDDMAINVVPSFAALESPSESAPRSKSLDTFTPGEKAGVFVAYQSGGTSLSPLSNIDAKWANFCYTADENGVLTRVYPDKPVYYDRNNSEKVDLYAYYPYDATLNSPATVNAYVFSVKTDQSSTGALNASDLCWAKNENGVTGTAITPSASPVKMHFEHKFSKINIKIKAPASINRVSAVQLHGIVGTAVLNIEAGTVALTTDAAKKVPVTIKPRSDVSVGTEGSFNVYKFDAIIPAQTFAANTAVLGFEITKNSLTEKLTLYAPSDLFGSHKLTCQSGKQYEWTVTVGSNAGESGKFEIKLNSTVKPWETGTAASGDLTNSITTTFSFADGKIASGINRVKVTTDENASTVFDIKTGVTVNSTTCNFKFTPESSSPRDYGFSITKLEFYNNTTLVHTWTGTSARVYNPTSMTLK